MRNKLIGAFFLLAAIFIVITGLWNDIFAAEPGNCIIAAENDAIECGSDVVEEPIYEDPDESQKIEEAIKWHYLENVELTAYCSCEECCDEYAADRPNGIVYTASGAVAQAGQTIAVDPDVIPLGAWVEIDGQLYHAEDTGNFCGAVVDIYFDDHDAAWDFGRRYANVRWYE